MEKSILTATGQGSSSRMALYGNSGDNLVLSAENTGEIRPIRGPVVGQSFGLLRPSQGTAIEKSLPLRRLTSATC